MKTALSFFDFALSDVIQPCSFLCCPGATAVDVISEVLIGSYKGFMTCFSFSPLWLQ